MTNILLDVEYVDKLKSRIKELEADLQKTDDMGAAIDEENENHIKELEAERDKYREALQEIARIEAFGGSRYALTIANKALED